MPYEDERPASKEWFERSQRVTPGGVCHNLRFFPPFPFFVSRAEGAYLWDEDGNRYIDYWMGHYTHILGHRHPEITEAVCRCIKEVGYHIGAVNRYQVELAELVVELIPSAEAVRFCSSGTEATMYAVRLARAYTGKKIVLKVAGGWHGANTDLCKGISHPLDEPESMGLPEGALDGVRLIPFNDLEGTKNIIEECGEDIACAIVEPVVGTGGFIPADKEYLLSLKEELHRRGAILVFDEVITGFRLSTGGYQKVVGVLPDLTVLGKVLGGGFPVGAVAGRRDILELGSHNRKKPNRVLMGGGTFSCNPVSMVAGITMLKHLVEKEKEIYPYIDGLGEQLRKSLDGMNVRGRVLRTTGIGSLFMVHIMREDRAIRSPEDVFSYTLWELRDTAVRRRLAERGVYMVHFGGAVSTAHRAEDVERTVEAVIETVEGID